MVETVLVTGGSGYVGSHTCKALAAAGYRPVVADNLRRGDRRAVKWGPCEEVELTDRDGLARVFATHRPSAVLHFAAYAYVGESVTEPDLYYRDNVGGLLSLLDVMRRHAVDRIVFSSTCAVYGTPQTLPIPEDHAKAPINPYGFSKLACERILEDYGSAYGLRAVALRYFNAAGADPDGEIGETHDPETHLIPLALCAASDPDFELTVFGDDYPTEDGTCIRDYIHVSDLAEAHCMALGHLEAGSPGGAFNLGTGQGHSVRQVVDTVSEVVGRPVKYRVAPRRPGDPAALVADSHRARQVLGWRPRHSALERIVTTAARWHRCADSRVAPQSSADSAGVVASSAATRQAS